MDISEKMAATPASTVVLQDIILRPAQLQDKKVIINAVDLLYLPIPQFIWNDEKFVEKQIQNNEYFLVEKDGQVLGVMSLRQRVNKINIETLVVKTEFQSRGFGTKFIEFAAEFTKEKGFDTLHAYSFNEYDMVNFYLKRGFSLLDYSGKYHNYPYYCFEKKL